MMDTRTLNEVLKSMREHGQECMKNEDVLWFFENRVSPPILGSFTISGKVF